MSIIKDLPVDYAQEGLLRQLFELSYDAKYLADALAAQGLKPESNGREAIEYFVDTIRMHLEEAAAALATLTN